MKFSYKKFILEKPVFLDRKIILRPILPIQIEYRNKQVGYEVVVKFDLQKEIFELKPKSVK